MNWNLSIVDVWSPEISWSESHICKFIMQIWISHFCAHFYLRFAFGMTLNDTGLFPLLVRYFVTFFKDTFVFYISMHELCAFRSFFSELFVRYIFYPVEYDFLRIVSKTGAHCNTSACPIVTLLTSFRSPVPGKIIIPLKHNTELDSSAILNVIKKLFGKWVISWRIVIFTTHWLFWALFTNIGTA